MCRNALVCSSTPHSIARLQCPLRPQALKHLRRTMSVVNTDEVRRPPNSSASVRIHVPARVVRLRAKRKPCVFNEGRDAHEDRKRMKKPSTMPGSRRISGEVRSKAVGFYQRSKTKHVQPTADNIQDAPVQHRKNNAPGIPTAIPTMLLFPPPPLPMPTATKSTMRRSLPPCRRSSYERLHGGPPFTIYEDRTETNRLFLAKSGYRSFPWDPAAATGRQIRVDDQQRGQENDTNGAQEISTADFADREPVPQPAVRSFGDMRTGQARSRADFNHVSEQAIRVLRMMR